VLARDRLLPRIAALLEVDRPHVQPSLRGHDAIVDLAAETRRPRANAQHLELLVADRRRERLVEHLVGLDPVVRGPDPGGLAEHHDHVVRLGLDVALRREPRPNESHAHGVAEALLGQEQEVVDAATEHHERRDDASLRCEEQRLAGVADPERLDVVRDHRLQVRGRVTSHDAHEIPGATSDTKRCDSHR
jgi:hypothetical protein